MATVHKNGNRRCWYCFYTDQNGKRRSKSTGTTNKKQAEKVCNSIQSSVEHAKAGGLTVSAARKIVSHAVGEIMMVSGRKLPSSTIRQWFERWIRSKEIEAEGTTHARYQVAVNSFIGFLKADADEDLSFLDADRITEYRDWRLTKKKISVSTVNTDLRIIRTCLNMAFRSGIIEKNPAAMVGTLKERGSKKKELSLTDMKTVLKTCGDTPWRGLVLLGFYTGQRLQDCATLQWKQVDLVQKEISFVTRKTGERLTLPLHEPIQDWLIQQPSTDDPESYVFPRFAPMALPKTSRLSARFAKEVLIPAGFMDDRPYVRNPGKTRGGPRKVNPITFHSLRHSFVSMLKKTGASEAIAQMIVGHRSEAVSRRYTHLSGDDARPYIERLPKV